MSEATPRPWRIRMRGQGWDNVRAYDDVVCAISADEPRLESDCWDVCMCATGESADPPDDLDAMVEGFTIANARLIVRAVNSHDALVAACKDIDIAWKTKAPLAWQPDNHAELLDRLRAALALAEQETP